MKTTLLQAARLGGEVLMRHYGRVGPAEHKGEIDLVTEADRQAETAIVEAIRKTFPHHDILAEEMDHGHQNSPWRWIIDPLDGTTNFAHGFPWFAVSIALEFEGDIIAGAVFNPCFHELFWASRGEGAWLNETRLGVSRTASLGLALVATGFPYDRRTCPVNNLDHFSRFQKIVQGCRRAGAASLDLAYTAAGRLDGYWEMKLKPWDVAAGKLLVEEAGGQVTSFDGAPFDIHGKECLASNDRIHQEMVKILAQGLRP